MRNLGKWIVAKGFKKLPKVQKIAQCGHTGDIIVHVESVNLRYTPFGGNGRLRNKINRTLLKSKVSVSVELVEFKISLSRSVVCAINSVTRWLNYFSICGRLHQWNLPSSIKIVKVVTKVCQIAKQKQYQIFPKAFKSLSYWNFFFKSGHTGYKANCALTSYFSL